MIPLLTRDESRRMDREGAEGLGLSSALLMENAGRGASDALLEHFPAPRRVVVVGGTGQNGGDAWVVARHLHCSGVAVETFIVGDPAAVGGDAAPNLAALGALGLTPKRLEPGALDGLRSACRHATVTVDGLFGTGLARPLAGLHAAVVGAIGDSGCAVLALDLPSGVDADTGAVLGCAPGATLTVTFGAARRGHYQHPGRGLCGALRVVPLGIPGPGDVGAACIEDADVAAALPPRQGDAHKGSAGHVLVVAGSPGKTGACLLAGRGALRGGAGLVTLAPREAALAAVEAKVVEWMSAALPEPAAGGEALTAEALLSLCAGRSSAVVGPGLGVDDGGRTLARLAALRVPIPAVVDADALTAVAGELELLRGAAAARVLTPHPGEAAVLLGCSAAEVQGDRHAAAAALCERSGQVVVLKGAGSIVAAPGVAQRVCARGTPALGVAGTGDVLAGAIAALLAVLPPLEAASCAVHLHAIAGGLASTADRGLLASEVADALPRALRACRGGGPPD